MNSVTRCPICRNDYDGQFEEISNPGKETKDLECKNCGRFKITRTACNMLENSEEGLTKNQQAYASYKIRNDKKLEIDSDFIRYIRQEAVFPNPKQQANNAIQYIGDEISKFESGGKIDRLADYFYTIIGAPSEKLTNSLMENLCDSGLVECEKEKIHGPGGIILFIWKDVHLSWEGFDRYEKLKAGE